MKGNHFERHKAVGELMAYRARVDSTQTKDTHSKSNQARKKRERIKADNARSLKSNGRKRAANDDIAKEDHIRKKKIVLTSNISFTCLNTFCYSSCFKQIYCYQHNLLRDMKQQARHIRIVKEVFDLATGKRQLYRGKEIFHPSS